MNFVIDAQLPRRLVYRLREAGHDVMHTLDLPQGNRTTDETLLAIAQTQRRVMVSKDTDFLDSLHTGKTMTIAVRKNENRELDN